MEVIKPGHVALCILSSMLFYPDEDDPTWPPSVQQKLRDVLVKEVRNVDELTHPSLPRFLQRVQAELGDSSEAVEVASQLREHVGRHMSEIECPDDLLTLNRLVGDMITNSTSNAEESNAPGADCNAHLGFFLRECYTAFEFMPFEAVCKLMTDCQQHLRVAAGSVAGWGEYLEPGGEQEGEGEGEEAREGAALKTHVELERALNHRVRRAPLEVGTAPRSVLESGLAGADVAAPTEPKVLLARHVSAVAHADLADALGLLHHYFDYAGKGQSDWLGKTTVDVATARAQERGRLQSASLSLGCMHARLGHMEEAMQALNETVRIAQQNSDDVCLCHALAALCHIVDATTPGTITSVTERRGAAGLPPAARHYSQLSQLMQRCLARSEELALPHLVAFARLALARSHLLHPQEAAPGPGQDGAIPASQHPGEGSSSTTTPGATAAPIAVATLAVADAVRDVAQLHLASELAAVVIQPLPMSTGRPASKLQRGIPDLFASGPPVFLNNTLGCRDSIAVQVERYAGAAHLLASAAWQLVGGAQLALVHSLTVLEAYHDCAPADDQCLALAQLAAATAAAHGYRAAEQVLAVADAKFPASQSKALRCCRLAIAHDRALHRHELRRAGEIAGQLAAMASPTDNTDIDIRLEAEERSVRTLAARGQTEAAAAAAHRLFAAAAEAGQTLAAVRLLVVCARIHADVGAALLALPYLLSARAHCRQLHLDVLGAEVEVLLAQVWLALGHTHAAHAAVQVEAVLPLLLAHGSLAQRLGVLLALAEILLAAHTSPASVAAEASRVLELLEEAGAAATRLEDWQAAAHCHHLAALVWEACGRPRERDAAAAASLRLTQLGVDGLG